MNATDRIKRLFKLRFAVIYPFGAFVVIFSHASDKSLRAGIGFIIAGLLVRAWANGYAIKLDKLTTSGPYALVRHPLYLGTMIIIVGFAIMLNTYHVGVLFIAMMAIMYYRTIKKEEAMLEAAFNDTYLDYKKNVPAVIPTVLPYRKGEKWPFSFRRLIQSQEYKPLIWVPILVIGFHLKSEFMVERETIDTKIISLLIIAFLLGLTDIAGELIKWKFKKNQ